MNPLHVPLAAMLLVLFLSSQARTQDPAEKKADDKADRGRKILQEALDKRGGRKALEAIRDFVLTLEGKREAGQNQPMAVQAVRKVLYGETSCLLDDTTATAGGFRMRWKITISGNQGYKQTRIGGGRMSPQAVARHWAGHHRSTLGILRALLDQGSRFTFVSKDKVEVKIKDRDKDKVEIIETEVVRIFRKGEPPLDVDVDPDTGYFLRVRWKERPRSGAQPEAMEILYGEFRSLEGLKGMPIRAVFRNPGKAKDTRKTVSMKVNTGLTMKDFPLQ